jgi:hypothetical protein
LRQLTRRLALASPGPGPPSLRPRWRWLLLALLALLGTNIATFLLTNDLNRLSRLDTDFNYHIYDSW